MNAPAGRGLALSVLAGTLLYFAMLVGTGQMNWREEVHEALLVARHDDPAAAQRPDFASSFKEEYFRTHRQRWGHWLLVFPLMVTGCTLLYFLPPLISLARNDPRSDRILLITVFLSPTVVGWVCALVMALRGPRRRPPGTPAAGPPPVRADP